MGHTLSYHPHFERALEGLLVAATDAAEFADGRALGRSRTASLRRLRSAIEELHRVSARLVLEAQLLRDKRAAAAQIGPAAAVAARREATP